MTPMRSAATRAAGGDRQRWIRRLLGCLLICIACACGAAEPANAIVFLKPGQFRWHPEVAPSGPVVVVVSLDEQRVYVYRNGIAIGVSTISSGRRGHETPQGTFTILQKARFHQSDLYDDAPMPYMQRLTWDGVAMHAGSLPGYPASHGCIRLPTAFASRLFEITRRGETIVVASAATSSAGIVHPALLAPIDPWGSPQSAVVREGAWWSEAPSYAQGPTNILVALKDRKAYVMRDGTLIAASPIEISGDFSLSGSLVLVATADFDGVPSRLDPLWPRRRWSVHAFDYVSTIASIDELAEHLRVPADFARRVNASIEPGTTVLVTDRPGIRQVGEPAPSGGR
ncbi:MAG TPA: L,D-transpeptidase family protein [Tahibacter sp.]|nr:L,D-transpeptidase family protein [Tahibacter sp.]